MRGGVASFEELFSVVPYSEEVLVAAEERAARIRANVRVHVVFAHPRRRGLCAERRRLRHLRLLADLLVRLRVRCKTTQYNYSLR